MQKVNSILIMLHDGDNLNVMFFDYAERMGSVKINAHCIHFMMLSCLLLQAVSDCRSDIDLYPLLTGKSNLKLCEPGGSTH